MTEVTCLGRRNESSALVGPVELDQDQIAATMGQALGLATQFLSRHLSNVARDCRDGTFAGTDNLVEEFTTAHRAAFQGSGREARGPTWRQR